MSIYTYTHASARWMCFGKFYCLAQSISRRDFSQKDIACVVCSFPFFLCLFLYITTYHMYYHILCSWVFWVEDCWGFVVEFIFTRARNYTSRSGVTHCIQLKKRQPIYHEMHEHVSHKFECDPGRLFMIHTYVFVFVCVCVTVCVSHFQIV